MNVRTQLVRVPVNPARTWNAAVGAVPSTLKRTNGGPNCPYSAVWRIGEQYPPLNTPPGEKEIVCVNFGTAKRTPATPPFTLGEAKTMSTKEVLEWGASNKLRPCDPRYIFALGEHIPNLLLDKNRMCNLVSLDGRVFQYNEMRFCEVDFRDGAEPMLCLGREFVGWYDFQWFAFIENL